MYSQETYSVTEKVWLSQQQGQDELDWQFIKSLRSQTSAQGSSGRIAVLDFDGQQQSVIFAGSGPNSIKLFPENLNYSKEPKQTPSRRLVVLEDLGREWVAALSRCLKVPLAVFARHWARPDEHTLGKVRVPLGQDVDYHFVLNYVQTHPIDIRNKNKDLTYRIACNANRTIAFNVKDDDGVQNSEQLVTYWGADLEDKPGSWIALLLVDPLLSKDMRLSIFIEEQQLTSLNREPLPINCFQTANPPNTLPELSRTEFPHSCQVLGGVEIPKRESLAGAGNSMFDDLVTGINGIPSGVPSSVTYGCRRLLLSKAAGTLQTTFTDAIRVSLDSSLGVDKMSALNFETFEAAAWNSKWEGSKFTKLWEQRENLELLRYKLRQNIQIVSRITESGKRSISASLSTSQRASPAVAAQFDKELELFRKVQHQDACDLQEWNDLDRMAEYINQVIVRTTESYLQTIGAREAQVANFQARSVGQLTRMATIFVPVSLCAAIFSMGGNFSAGNRLFWLFWAISLPIAAALIILMFSPLGTALTRLWNMIKTLPTRTRVKVTGHEKPTHIEALKNGWRRQEADIYALSKATPQSTMSTSSRPRPPTASIPPPVPVIANSQYATVASATGFVPVLPPTEDHSSSISPSPLPGGSQPADSAHTRYSEPDPPSPTTTGATTPPETTPAPSINSPSIISPSVGSDVTPTSSNAPVSTPAVTGVETVTRTRRWKVERPQTSFDLRGARFGRSGRR